MSRSKEAIREDIIRAVLRRVASERDDPNAFFDAELEYCDDRIEELAKELVEAEQ